MPRLAPTLFRAAAKKHPFLPLLLPELRDVDSATIELNWLKEYVDNKVSPLHCIPQYGDRHKEHGEINHDNDVDIKSIGLGRSFLRRDSNGQREIIYFPHLNGKKYITFDEKGYGKLRLSKLKSLCYRRGITSEPIQYITGFTPFGHLNINCRKGILIPRQDTHDVFYHLAALLLENISDNEKRRGLNILDLGTGTGAIPLLLCSLLVKDGEMEKEEHGIKKRFFGGFESVKLCGVDFDKQAVELANYNLRKCVEEGIVGFMSEWKRDAQSGGVIGFLRGDIFDLARHRENERSKALLRKIEKFFNHEYNGEMNKVGVVDIVTANPPYISPTLFKANCTGRSVKRWEPKRALIPPLESSPTKYFPSTRLEIEEEHRQADRFYPVISHIARHIFQAKALIVEIGDREQAERVRRIFTSDWLSGNKVKDDNVIRGSEGGGIALWRDFSTGEQRAVVAWRNIDGEKTKEWAFLGKDLPLEKGSFWNAEVGGEKMVWMGKGDFKYQAAKCTFEAEKRKRAQEE